VEVIDMRKTPLYYPVKTDRGFRIEKTYKSTLELGFAAFKKKKTAEKMGKIWYGD
jgi:hypothetical protein